MRKNFLYGVAVSALLLAVSGPVQAADMVDPIDMTMDWSGAYVGAFLGYGDVKFQYPTEDGKISDSAVLGGVDLGYNWQSDNIVFGIEADGAIPLDSLEVNGNKGSGMSDKIDALASLRGRLGIAFDQILVYGTGGGALAFGNHQCSTEPCSNSFADFGGVVGAGIEFAATENVSVRAEGLYYIFNQKNSAEGESTKLKDVMTARIGVNFNF